MTVEMEVIAPEHAKKVESAIETAGRAVEAEAELAIPTGKQESGLQQVAESIAAAEPAVPCGKQETGQQQEAESIAAAEPAVPNSKQDSSLQPQAESIAPAPTEPVKPQDQPQPIVPRSIPPLPEDPELAALYAKILKQIEFYFGDANLPNDKFLLSTINANPEGWVSIATLLTFNRVKAMSEDPALVAAALRQSPYLLEVSEDGTMVRRITQIKGRYRVNRKTIYAKGFPREMTNIIDELQAFFSNHGKVVRVQVRREHDKSFKGSVFVEFRDESEAANVRQMTLQYQGSPLLLLMKHEYVDQKLKEFSAGRENEMDAESEPKERKEVPQLSYLPRAWFPRPPSSENGSGQIQQRQRGPDRPNRALLFFEGVGPMTLFEDVKEFFNRQERVRWVSFSTCDTKGSVLFALDDAAVRVLEKLGEGELLAPNGIGRGTTTLRLATEQEVTDFWVEKEKLWGNSQNGGSRGRGGRGGREDRGGRRGRGGRGGRGDGRGGRGGHRSQDRNARPPTIEMSNRTSNEAAESTERRVEKRSREDDGQLSGEPLQKIPKTE